LQPLANISVKKSLLEIPKQGWHLLLVNYDSLSSDERELLAQQFASKNQYTGKLLIYSSDHENADLTLLLSRLSLANFLGKNGEVDAEELYVTVHKLLSQDIFGIDKYFSWGARSWEKTIQSSEEKKLLLQEVSTFATEVGLQSRFVDMFSMVAEELVTNALYDAPVDQNGKHRFSHYSRNQTVTLEKKESLTVTLCCDGRRIGISVSDSFGSLTPQKILDYLIKCFKKGENQIDRKQGGAGLGLYFTFKSVSHLIFNITPSEKTEVIGIIDIRNTYKDFVKKSKSLNIFIRG
jgi:signal transduction histidine kinase